MQYLNNFYITIFVSTNEPMQTNCPVNLPLVNRKLVEMFFHVNKEKKQ